MNDIKVNPQGMIPEHKENKMKEFLRQFDVTELVCLLSLVAICIAGMKMGMTELSLTIAGALCGYLTKSAVKPNP